MLTIKLKAEEMLHNLETKKRTNGEEFICLKDEAPEWMRDVARQCHGEMMPDDWKYRFIREALGEITRDDIDHPEDIYMEADIYTHDLLKWLSSNISRTAYMDEALPAPKDYQFENHLMAAQQFEKSEVLYALCEALGRLE